MALVQLRERIIKPVVVAPDAKPGTLWHETITFSAGVHTITLPDSAVGFRLTPITNDAFYAVNEDPVASAGIANTAITISNLKAGGTAIAGSATVGYFPPVEHPDMATGRTLRLLGTNTSTCKITIF